MKITVFSGSARKNSNSDYAAKIFCEAAKENGHEYEIIKVTDYSINPCQGCLECKEVGTCVQKDDFTNKLIQKIKDSDCIVFASPVYFGQISGQLKTFFDRWGCFFDEKYDIKVVPGKKFAVITVGAGDSNEFSDINDYMIRWLSDFFKMKCVGSFHIGDVLDENEIKNKEDALNLLSEAGKML
jgi:multimeric flavodoxin WrbA